MQLDASTLKIRRKELKLTQEELARRIGVSKRTIINYEGGEVIPRSKSELLRQVLFGESEKVNPEAVEVKEPFEKYVIETKNGAEVESLPDGKYLMKVKLVPVKAYARYVSEVDDAIEVDGYDHVYFTVDHVPKGKYRAFEIKGDSMDNGQINDTPEKARVLARELQRHHWRDGFRDAKYGWIIVTRNNIVFKDIVNQDLLQGTITCHSRNTSPEYSDFNLSLDDDVRQIWKVIKREF